ncbi:MAG: hypothetical protein M3276_08730, partial [Actinomycetota bacterium]|nr:hypothetical protein [Actinomycetota bacterium]
ADRSRELAARATSAGGTAYDELRAELRRHPYGEDRLTADAADRACWQQHSPLARGADATPGLVEELERLLEA